MTSVAQFAVQSGGPRVRLPDSNDVKTIDITDILETDMPAALQDFSAHDQQIWDEELQDFVPDRVFDAHIHMFNRTHLLPSATTSWTDTDLSTLQQWAGRLYPGRETHFLVLGTPTVGMDIAAHNNWCIEQVRQDPQSRMNRLVTPSCRIADIERDIREQGFVGLKPYRLYSVTGDIAQCRIHEFLPHEQLELANELGLWVTMHLSRFHGCADEYNLADLQEYTSSRYPKIKWILAHCARSFTYWPIRKAIEQLREMPNIWYDVSAVTDVRPLITLFTRENPRRIFYGSDGVDATYFHGQYAALGRAWQYVDIDRFNLQFPHCDGRPILAIYEQLLSMKHAAEIAQFSQTNLEDLFWRNAATAFNVKFAGDEPPVPVGGKSVTQSTYERAKLRIPGGTQLLSKRPEMYAPGVWPAYYREARGCEVVDLDGRRFTDMTTSGIGSCLLGFADPDVTEAVQRRIARIDVDTEWGGRSRIGRFAGRTASVGRAGSIRSLWWRRDVRGGPNRACGDPPRQDCFLRVPRLVRLVSRCERQPRRSTRSTARTSVTRARSCWRSEGSGGYGASLHLQSVE